MQANIVTESQKFRYSLQAAPPDQTWLVPKFDEFESAVSKVISSSTTTKKIPVSTRYIIAGGSTPLGVAANPPLLL